MRKINPAFDLTGEEFGRWKVLEQVDPPDHIKQRTKAYWLCECQCGRQIIVKANNLRTGRSKSCGCGTLKK